MSTTADVCIIGAGPYGLSLAAHLSKRRVAFRIFGTPMENWARHMPAGMQLKSDGFASDLYDPARRFTLAAYCRERGIPYADLGLPVDATTFVDYGVDFQRRLVPDLEQHKLHSLQQVRTGFRLELDTGDIAYARNVVIATGISYFQFVPQVLRALPGQLCSHSFQHRNLSVFRGHNVVVVGAGASATDLAALLHAAGASVTLLARHEVHFHRPPAPRSPWQRLREPNLGLGPSLRSALCTVAPGMFRLLPAARRLQIVKHHLGPAGGWFSRDRVVGRVTLQYGYNVERAEVVGDHVRLQCRNARAQTLELRADHVIAATGYRVALPQLPFLSPPLLRTLATLSDGSPVLSRHLESSAAGLYFTGLAAAASFGPLLRFALGARYSAQRLSAQLAHRRRGRARDGAGLRSSLTDIDGSQAL